MQFKKVKGKDGLFKNKVWVPSNSQPTTGTTSHHPKPRPRPTPYHLRSRHKPTLSKNKVWKPPPQSDNETEVIFLTPKPVSRAKPVLQEDPVPLVGQEVTTKQGNKQWVGTGSSPSKVRPEPVQDSAGLSPKVQDGPDKLVKPVQLVGHEKKTKRGNKQWVVASSSVPQPAKSELGLSSQREQNVSDKLDKPVKPVQLVGHEKKTKRGNKQWVMAADTPPSSTQAVGPDKPVKQVRLVGHEKKTKQGNKQWVVAGLASRRVVTRKSPRLSRLRTPSLVSFSGSRFTLDPSGKRLKRLSASAQRRSPHSSRLRPWLVSLSGGRYTMDSSGKKLKRLSGSLQQATFSPAVNSYLGGVAKNSSVKRIMAR